MTSDQKRALGIGVVGIGAILLWRRMRSTATTAPTLTNAYAQGASGSVAPYTPQSPITVAPGESVYDPNSEAFLNTPTSGLDLTSTGTYGPPGEQQLGGPTPQAVTPSAPSYIVNVNYPRRPAVRNNRKRAAKRKPATRR